MIRVSTMNQRRQLYNWLPRSYSITLAASKLVRSWPQTGSKLVGWSPVCWWKKFKICEHLAKLQARSNWPTTYHMQKHFVAISFLLRRSTYVLSYCVNFSMATLCILVNELNNAKMTVRNFNNCFEWLGFAWRLASYTQILSMTIFWTLIFHTVV